MANELTTNVPNRLARLETLVKKLLNQNEKLLKSTANGSSSGSAAEFENGIMLLGSGKYGLGGELTEQTHIIASNGGLDFVVGNASESSAMYLMSNGMYVQAQHPLIDDAGYVYIDLGNNNSTGFPYMDLYVEGGPGADNHAEILFEPGLLAIYLGANTVFEIPDLVEDNTAPTLMVLNASGEVKKRTVASLGIPEESGGGATLIGTNIAMQAPGDGVLYSAPGLLVPVVTGRLTKFEMFLPFLGGSSNLDLSTKLLWTGVGAIPDIPYYSVVLELFCNDAGGLGLLTTLLRKLGSNAPALDTEIVWNTMGSYVAAPGMVLRITGSISNNTGTDGGIQFQYKTSVGVGLAQIQLDNAANVEYSSDAVS